MRPVQARTPRQRSPCPGWNGAHGLRRASVLGTPEAAARSFMFVLDGEVDVHAGAIQRALLPDDFAYFPPDTAHMCAAAARLRRARPC